MDVVMQMLSKVSVQIAVRCCCGNNSSYRPVKAKAGRT